MNCQDLEYGQWTIAANFFCNEQEAKENNFICQKCEKTFEMFEFAWKGINEEDQDYLIVWCEECFKKEKQNLIEYLKEMGNDKTL